MTNDTIQVPIKRIVEGKAFYSNSVAGALEDCAKAGYEAQFMPVIADTRIFSPKESSIWQNWFVAPSIKATGRTGQGLPVVVYAHVPNYFSNPENIRTAIQQGLVNGAGRMPQEEFQRLLDLEDKANVFVVPHSDLRNSTSGVIKVSKALAHPQTIPFLGGKERAEDYLKQHEKDYGSDIGIWYCNDLADESLARTLFVGLSYNSGLDGGHLNNNGRVLGVRVAEGDARKIFPNKAKLIEIAKEYAASRSHQELTQRLNALFS